jgi:Flp pilus assembly protein TadD
MGRIAVFVFMIALNAAGSPQNVSNPSTDEVLRSMLADLRGGREVDEGTGTPANPSLLPMAFPAGGVWAEPRPASANPDSSPPSVVSAKHLRHKVPKAAMKAYKNGEKLSRQHHPDKASQELEQAIAPDPDFSDAHGDLGVQYARLNRLPDAEAELRRALALDPEDDLHHSNLGWILFWQGRFDEAEASVKRALRLAPGSASAHMLLGRLMFNRAETRADGLKHLEYAARVMPAAKAMLKALR